VSKLVSAAAAVQRIKDGATVLVDGSGGGINEPGAILDALEARFANEVQPSGLTVVHPSGMGDGQGGGMDRLAHKGMVRRVIGGHWNWCRGMQRLATTEQIEAYCLPQGVLSHLLRAIAGHGPGVITQVGLGTFVDPRRGGGRLNARARDTLVELIELKGREYLFYAAFPVDVAIIRGTTADEDGNITMEDEGLFAETLSAAQAARNSGGIVIAQVRNIVPPHTLDPRRVKVPGVLVDAVVHVPAQRLSFATDHDPTLVGAARTAATDVPLMPLSERKVIARRAAGELRHADIVNLGFGMPDGVAAVLAEEAQGHAVTLTVEQGHIGGVPVGGADFGLARNQSAMLDAGYQFDWYDGGGLDIAILSFAQVDPEGNVNVSKFGDRIAGIGGFVNISQGAKRVVFVGTMRAGKQELEFTPDGIRIGREAPSAKFVKEVDQISFSGEYARRWGKPVLFVTERAVFELGPEGLVLIEVAPGLDVEQDVIGQMQFRPQVSSALRRMDKRLFGEATMGLQLGGKAAPQETVR